MTKRDAQKKLQSIIAKALGFKPTLDNLVLTERNDSGQWIKGFIKAEWGTLYVSYDGITVQLQYMERSNKMGDCMVIY